MPIKANNPQADFLQMPHKFRAFVAGYGSGKTWVGCMAKCIHYLEKPKINQGYFAPTYPHIRDIFFPTVEEVAHSFGLRVEIREGNKEVHYYMGRQYRGTTICRSMQNPIIGFKIGHGLIDELDVMSPDKAKKAWYAILARMRYTSKRLNLKNGLDVTTTPEGFKFTHEMFKAQLIEKPELKKNYGRLHASTYENEKNLPDDYIDSLFEAYPKELRDAYIRGKFVNLTTGTVYRRYDRTRCNSSETIQPREPLYVGMDFNVGHMSASIFVQRESGWHAVAELKDLFDTPDMIRVLEDKYQTKEDMHSIFVYPDASGKSKKSLNASLSDIALLEQAGFSVRAKKANPRIKDRVMSVNKQFEIGNLWVNAKACPTIAKCLEQQAYDANGEPDKKSGFDHQCFHGDQEVYVNGSKIKFKNIPKSGEVLCPDGKYHKYINGGIKNGGIKNDFSKILLITLSNGATIKCTDDHMFLTCGGWKKSINLIGEKLCDRELLAELNKSTKERIITFVGRIFKEMAKDFIGKSTEIIMETFPKVLLFTTRMKTSPITNHSILSLCKKVHTPLYMASKKQQCQLKLSTQLLNGTKAKKVESGTKKTMKAIKKLFTKKDTQEIASGVDLSSGRTRRKGNISAQKTVRPHTEEQAGLTMRKDLAKYVEKNLSTINTRKKKRVLENAPHVLRIEQSQKSKVYCLTVPDMGMFEVSGVVASNCDSFGYPIAYEFPIVKPVIDMNFSFAS